MATNTGAHLLTSAVLAAGVLAGAATAAAQAYSESASPVCAKAASELARVKDLKWDPGFTIKGDLSAQDVERYTALLKTADCNCAAAESTLEAIGRMRGPERRRAEPLRRLAVANLELSDCRQPPDVVVAVSECLADELQSTVASNLADALQHVTDPRVKPLVQDSVVRRGCVDVVGKRVTRFGVWRRPYGNPDVLSGTPGTGPKVEDTFAVHMTAAGLQRLLVDFTPTLKDLLADHSLNLRSGDAQSLHLSFDGVALPGEGTASAKILADLKVLQFETSLFEVGLSITDALHIETAQQQAEIAGGIEHRADMAVPDRSALRCETHADADRGLDALRVALALFVVPTFGPGVAGGIEWLSNRALGDELSQLGIAGAVCSIVDGVPAHSASTGNIVMTLNYSRAEADAAGVHVFGAFGLQGKEPLAWVTVPFGPASLVPRPGVWLTGNTRDLYKPQLKWVVVSGTEVAEPQAAADACGPRPAKAHLCVTPQGDKALWITLSASEKDTGLKADASFFQSASETTFCSSLGCADYTRH